MRSVKNRGGQYGLPENWKLFAAVVVPLLLAATGYVWYLLSVPHNLSTEIPVPTQSDWMDLGEIFPAGELGEWDYQQWGGFANSIVRKGDTFYLYYQGASGYRTSPDETVTGRAIGVATSSDGINFVKYDKNPVITWSTTDNGEEGAVSSAAVLDENGEIVLFYGANTEESPSSVNSDGRLAVSTDGYHFDDLGIVLNRRDRTLWASGDELFPILALRDLDRWIVYYLPNGRLRRRQVGVAWGSERLNLTDSAAVRAGFSPILAWGTAGHARIGSATHALLFNNVPTGEMRVRLMSVRNPSQLSEPVASYQFEGISQATFMLDEAVRTWFMYYRHTDSDGYGVMLAAAGAPDNTPPTAPNNLRALPISHSRMKLSWDPATDPDTGIASYEVYREGEQVATVKGWEFVDDNLMELARYSYEVAATNYHGVTGGVSEIEAVTLSDVFPPLVSAIFARPTGDELVITFDEPVERSSAETIDNYEISPELIVRDASLTHDQRVVVLGTSAHERNTTYKVTIRNVRDQSQLANIITPGTQHPYTFSKIDGLAGAWSFDLVEGLTIDTANFGNHGVMHLDGDSVPSTVPGVFGNALQFDGLDDHVTISGAGSLAQLTDGSYSLSLWAKPEGKPLAETNNDTDYSLLTRRFNGLYFDARGRYRSQIQFDDRSNAQVASEPVSDDRWHHIVMVCDEDSKSLHLYVDGREVPDSPVRFEGDLPIHGLAPYFIGTSDPLRNRYENRFAGGIDEVRIYNQALQPDEVKSLFHLGE